LQAEEAVPDQATPAAKKVKKSEPKHTKGKATVQLKSGTIYCIHKANK